MILAIVRRILGLAPKPLEGQVVAGATDGRARTRGKVTITARVQRAGSDKWETVALTPKKEVHNG